jgi:DNA-directed RNA polymerase specialized sigma24 family protein
MNIVSSIASHIPYLRRFARALTGSQASGDAYVAATLEAVVEGTGAGDPAPTRLSLFRAFLRIWGSIPVNQDGTADPENRLMQTTHSRLEAITPLPRVAFLLNALEGFSTEEMAEVMGRPRADIQALLGMASSEIAAHLSTDVLIIEDEPIIAMDLEAVVTSLGHRVLQVARTRTEAVAALADHRPGLVLADEPTGNLDPETAGRILDLLLAQARDRRAAVLIVTHSEMVAAAADRVLRLSASGLLQA